MDLEIADTKDGSKTVYSKRFDAAYHSWYGAITESKHVFIENGLRFKHLQNCASLKILEVGYGTGLNAMLSAVYALENDIDISYSGIDKYEVPKELLDQLYYTIFFEPRFHEFLRKINAASYNDGVRFNDNFALVKSLHSLNETSIKENNYDLVYFDAFSPRQAPHMWTKEVFELMYSVLKPGGVLVTSCTQSQFKRDLEAVGFIVESLNSSPGKREMTRAIKENKQES